MAIDLQEYLAAKAQLEASGRKMNGINAALALAGIPDPAQLAFFRCTDVGNAERLHYLHGETIKYCFAFKTWLIYDGKKWSEDRTGRIIEMAKDTIKQTKAQAMGNEALETHCKRSESRGKIMAMIELAQPLCPVLPEEMDSDSWLLNCQNGVVNLRTGKIAPHDPALMLGKITMGAYRPGYYPDWEKVVAAILPDKEVRDYIQTFAGYSCCGSVKEEKFIFSLGDGGRGKGTMIESIGGALGDYSTTLAVEILLQSKSIDSGQNATPELAKLPGMRMVLAGETNQEVAWNEAKTKQITGGDRLTARRLHCGPFDFMPNFKIWFSSNHKPNVRDHSDGFWRRVSLVTFDQDFTGDRRNIDLKETLHGQDMTDQILSWAIDGCMKWQSQGRLIEPDSIKAAVAAYRTETDLISRFLEECCNVAPRNTCGSRRLYQQFKDYCADNGNTPYSQSNFTKLLEAKGFKKLARTKAGILWSGLDIDNGYNFS